METILGQHANTVFTILGGTTIPDRAAVVRADCRAGSNVELRRQDESDSPPGSIDVWLECNALLGLLTVWKKIGHVPYETAAQLMPPGDASSTVVAYGKVKTVYAPAGRDEAVVSVELSPAKPR